MSEVVTAYFRKHDIEFTTHEHPAVYTVEEAKLLRSNIPGLHCKNLFLLDKKRQQYYLLTTPADKQFKISQIRKQVGAKNLSFAPPEDLQNILGVDLGAASPLGLINDTKSQVTFLVDEDVWNSTTVTFHPNVNTITLEMSKIAFHKYVDSIGVQPIILQIQENY